MNIKIVTDVSKDNSASIFRVHKLITFRILRDPDRGENTSLWKAGEYNLKRRNISGDLYTAVPTPKYQKTRISVEG